MKSRQYRSASAARTNKKKVWGAFFYAIWLQLATPELAHADAVSFDIAAQPMPAALQAFAVQARMQLLYEHAAIANVVCNPISGELDTRAALERLLRGTGLEIIYSAENAATIRLTRASNEKELPKEHPLKSSGNDTTPVQPDSPVAKDK